MCRTNRMVTLRKTNMQKAKQRAQKSGPTIFSGEEALAEVAKDDGLWNWALVGPDPEALPLSGGGLGSVDEMRGAVGKHAHSFGLLRMTFSASGSISHKWMFIHASDPIDSGNYSAVERGKAMGMEPVMDKAIRRFVAVAGKVHVQSKEECTVEHLVGELRSIVEGMAADNITVENFNAAVLAHKEANPQIEEAEKIKEEKAKAIEQLVTPLPAAVTPEAEVGAMDMVREETRQRKRVKLYVTGDLVDVYSSHNKKWFTDGEIADVTKDGMQIDGFQVRAGSMKVVYDNGSRFKWVAPQQMDNVLQPSARPRPPGSKVGHLQKETNSWFGAKYGEHYVELNHGFLKWWATYSDAARGASPQSALCLMGLQLVEDKEGMSFRMRTQDSRGVVFGFKADSEEEAQAWVELFWEHAWYCEELYDYTLAQRKKKNAQKELLSVMQGRVKE
jgi:hypothetical protein